MALMFAALGPVLPLMAEHFGGRTGGALAAQMILTMPAIGVILGGIAGGYSVERWGPKPVLVVALIAYAILGASGYLIDNLSILLVTRFLVGFSVAHVGTSIAVVVASWFEGVARVKLLGYQSAVAGVFAVICLLMSGLLAEAGGWRAPFLLYTMAFVVLFLVLAGLPRGVARVVPSQASSADRPSLRPLVTLWPIYALAMFLFVAYFMTSIQMSFLLSEDGVKSPLIRSIIIATGVLAGGIFGGFYGRFYAWLGERGVQIFLTTMMATGLGIIGFSTNLWMIALGVALSGGGGGMIPPHISGILLNRVPSVLRARAVGFEFTVLYIADFVNPLVITPLRAVIGIHNAFLVVAAALAVAVLAMAMVLKRHLPTG
ncbi:MAG: MFS transporter [Sphingomonadales bacterium]